MLPFTKQGVVQATRFFFSSGIRPLLMIPRYMLTVQLRAVYFVLCLPVYLARPFLGMLRCLLGLLVHFRHWCSDEVRRDGGIKGARMSS